MVASPCNRRRYGDAPRLCEFVDRLTETGNLRDRRVSLFLVQLRKSLPCLGKLFLSHAARYSFELPPPLRPKNLFRRP